MFADNVKVVYTFLAANVPLILWGPPGTGKTATITHLARRLGWHLEVVIGSTRDRTDFGGFPVDRPGGVEVVPFPWVKRLAEAGEESILFLDELASTPEDVMPALLRVLAERYAGDVHLPGRIVAASNQPKFSRLSSLLDPAMANRFGHLEWQMDPREWALGKREGFHTLYPDLPPLPSPDRLRAAQSWADQMVSLYLERNPTHAYQEPEGEESGYAWPSYRTWDLASRVLAAARALGFSESIQARAVAALVGRNGFAFMTFVREMDLPDPGELMRRPELLPEKDDRAYAALMAVASAAISIWSEAAWRGAFRVLARAADTNRADLAVPAFLRLIRARDQAERERRPTFSVPEEVALRFAPLVQGVAAMRQRR